jgi:hypothetical protein
MPTTPPRKVGWRLPTSIAVVALMALGIFVAVLHAESPKRDATAAFTSTSRAVPSQLSPSARTTSGSVKASTVGHTAHSTSAAANQRTTPPAGKTITAPKGTTTVHVSGSSPSRPTATASCRPLNIFGTCFLVGELCPTADHGLTGVADGGQAVKCVAREGNWVWELA